MTDKTVIDTRDLLPNTIIPLWLGAGKTAGNITGALGAGLQGVGQLFDLTPEQIEQQQELYKSTGEFVGLPENLRLVG